MGAQIRKIPDVDTRYQMTFTFFFPGWSQPDDQLSDAAKQRLQNGFTNPYKKNVSVPTSHDPNEITGPAAYGSQGFIPANDSLPYRIDFTNQATATAPAQTVVVTQQLSTNLDLSTFQLGDIGFGSTVISVPAGQTSYSTRVTLPSAAPAGTGPDGLYVDISASLNMQTGLVTWTFTSIDPTTLDVPMNPLEGFLPPDENEPEGEGYVSYTVSPRSSVTTGAVINAQATVVFDQNAPINTAQITNTIDATVPTSSVNALPATTGSADFTVSWSGSDGSGSGIASYDVFVSDDGGSFVPFMTDTTSTSAIFDGQVGHTYSFYSIAISNVGIMQAFPAAAQASTLVVSASLPFQQREPIAADNGHRQASP